MAGGKLPKPPPLRSNLFFARVIAGFFLPAGFTLLRAASGRDTIITRQSVVFLVGLLPASQGAFAAEPQPWGVHLQWHTPSPVTADSGDVSPLLIRRALEASAEQIQALEAQWGPYAPELTPALESAAREAEEYGETATALELYRWALHSTRINKGLSSVDQLPILERIIELMRDSGDREELANQIDYFYRLLGRGAKPWTDQRLAASVRWLSVHSELLASYSWGGRESDVLFVIDHGADLVSEVCEDPAWAGRWCKELTLSVLKLYYLLDYRIDPLVVDEFGVAQDRYNSPYQQSMDESPGEYRLRSRERSLGTKARGMLDRALELMPDDDELRVAKGDWLLNHGRRSRALSIYRELQVTGRVDFSTPQPTPTSPPLSRDTRLSDSVTTVDVTAVVTARGGLRDVQITQVSQDGKPAEGFARRQLRETRFRPALDAAGEPVDAAIAWRIDVLR